MRQNIGTYTSTTGVCVVDSKGNGVRCKSVFKSENEKNKSLTDLWVEIINYLEKENTDSVLGNPYQNPDRIEVNGT